MNPCNVVETTPHTEPFFNSVYPITELQWPSVSATTFPYSESNDQRWHSQLTQRGATDDPLGVPFELENLAWPELNIEQADDDLLTQLLKLDTYGSDASGSTIDALTPQLKHMKISPRKSPFSDLKPSLKMNQFVRFFFFCCPIFWKVVQLIHIIIIFIAAFITSCNIEINVDLFNEHGPGDSLVRRDG